MDSFTKTIKIWINGKSSDSISKIEIQNDIASLKRLKEIISKKLKVKANPLKIYLHHGLELEDSDIEYLIDGEILYVSPDGSQFSIMNYVHEHEFVKWIKAGGFGQVFLAKNVINKELYAIKKVDLNNMQNDDIYNIYREALYLKNLRHRNIVKFHFSYIHENVFYNVMDYAKGGELGSLIAENKQISEFTAKKLFKQIHDAVMYIHSKNVIHRDLKPGNILFLDEEKEKLVLIDFGISGFNSGNIKESIFAGTTRFMPPECASGLNFASNPKIDLWAMGVILYYMVFGIFPFEGTSSEIKNKIIYEDQIYPSHIKVSKACINLINGLLEKNVQFRIGEHDVLFQKWYEDENCENFVVINTKIEIKEEKIERNNDNEPNQNNNINSKKNYERKKSSAVKFDFEPKKISSPIKSEYKRKQTLEPNVLKRSGEMILSNYSPEKLKKKSYNNSSSQEKIFIGKYR